MTVIVTSQSSITWHIARACNRSSGWPELDAEPCRIDELEHFDEPTGELWCLVHLTQVGYIHPDSPWQCPDCAGGTS